MVVPKSNRAPYAVAPTPRSPRHRKPQTKPQSGCHSTYPASSLSFDACNTSLSILNGFIPNPLEYDSIRPCRRGLHPQLPMLSTPGHRCPGRCQNGVFIGVLIVPHAARSRASTLRLAARHRHGTAPRTHARLPGRRRLPDRKPPAVRPNRARSASLRARSASLPASARSARVRSRFNWSASASARTRSPSLPCSARSALCSARSVRASAWCLSCSARLSSSDSPVNHVGISHPTSSPDLP